MSRTTLAIRHVSFEDLGLLEPLLADHGYSVRYIDAGTDPIDHTARDADLLVVLGGPVGANDVDRYPWLRDEIRTLTTRIADGGPVLGICLGAQLIATALDAPVTSTGRVVIGYAPITLTAEGERSVLAPLARTPVLHWHGDQAAIPEGALRLAETPDCATQAFSAGTNVLALQFHLEADHSRIERWLIGHAHELATHGIDPNIIRADAIRHGPLLAERASTVLADWLDHS